MDLDERCAALEHNERCGRRAERGSLFCHRHDPLVLEQRAQAEVRRISSELAIACRRLGRRLGQEPREVLREIAGRVLYELG